MSWKTEIEKFTERQRKVAAGTAAALLESIRYNNALGEGNILLEHVTDYLIGEPWNMDTNPRFSCVGRFIEGANICILL